MSSSKVKCEKSGQFIKVEESVHPVTITDNEKDRLDGTLPAIISRVVKVNGQVRDVEMIPVRIQAA